MGFLEILLVIISSAGLLHGTMFAMYLLFIKKKRTLPNSLLALILLLMAFRIGKSVLLYFGHDLEPAFIFAGLAFLLSIGPMLRWYVTGMTRSGFKLPKFYLFELIPFILVFLSSFFVNKAWFETNNKEVIIIFGSVLIFVHLHFAFYIFLSSRVYKKTTKDHPKKGRTKSQKAIFSWLGLVHIGFIIIWISYVLNIVEDAVPYIVGPIMYSAVVYFLSFKAFQLKVTDMDGSAFKSSNDMDLFRQLTHHLVDNKLYLESNISLSSLSKLVNVSTQKTSEVINEHARQNFNDFVNFYRVQEAKKRLVDEDSQHFTISSIAFDSGFSSLSSFNSAFKKFEGLTPSMYRKTQV